MKKRFMKNGVFSLEYDKETLKDMVLELREEIEILKEKNEKEFADYIKFKKEQYDEYLKKINKLIKENQELKKKLEENKKFNNKLLIYNTNANAKILKAEKFINYLEDEIKHKSLNATCMFEYNDTVLPLKEILQKYKEIIGVSDEINNLRRINMKYYYEYKEKNGCKVGGHNLENIDFFDNYIRLLGVDIIPTNYDYEKQHWGILLDMNEIEYLKIEPMQKTTN